MPPILLVLTKTDLAEPVEGQQPNANLIKITDLKEKAANAKCRDVESTSAKKWEGNTVTKAFEMIVGRACEFKL